MTEVRMSAHGESHHEELAITLWRPEVAALAETEESASGDNQDEENFSFGSRLTLGQRAVMSAYGLLACGIGMFVTFVFGMVRISLILSIVFAGYVGLAYVTWREYREQKDIPNEE